MPPAPPIDPIIEVLLAQLHKTGLLTGDDLSNMANRLESINMEAAAYAVRFIPLANAMDEPDERRAGFEVIEGGGIDGGNEAD
ncbi:MAG: hypothetical protein ACK4ZW_08575 [Blastomonas sp.]